MNILNDVVELKHNKSLLHFSTSKNGETRTSFFRVAILNHRSYRRR